MIAISILFCVTMVASAPLGASEPWDVYGPKGLQQAGQGSWGYVTNYNPVWNLGYTAMYNAAEKTSPVAFGHSPVSQSALAGLQPYGMADFPGNGVRYIGPAHDPYGYQDPSHLPSGDNDFQGNYETKSDISENEEVEDVRQDAGANNKPRPMKPFINTMVNVNRLRIMRLVMRNVMMITLG